MNLTFLNKVIRGLNCIAEGITTISKACEDLAWEFVEDHAGSSGARPITAAELHRPDLEAEAQAYEQAQAEAPPAPAPSVTLVQLRTLLSELSQAGHTAKVRELLQTAGFHKLSEVPESYYPAVFAQAKEMRDGTR
ncbi:hypothetical protein [Rothia sp. 32237D007AR]